MIYEVKITETLVKRVKVIADSEDEAIDDVKEQYENCSIVLDAEDFEPPAAFEIV